MKPFTDVISTVTAIVNQTAPVEEIPDPVAAQIITKSAIVVGVGADKIEIGPRLGELEVENNGYSSDSDSQESL